MDVNFVDVLSAHKYVLNLHIDECVDHRVTSRHFIAKLAISLIPQSVLQVAQLHFNAIESTDAHRLQSRTRSQAKDLCERTTINVPIY